MKTFAALLIALAGACVTPVAAQDFGYPGSSLSSYDLGSSFEAEEPTFANALFSSMVVEARATDSPAATYGANSGLSDPFDDLNRTLASSPGASAPGSSAKFRVIATAQGDIGLLTAKGFRMKKWSEGAALPSREGLDRKIQVQYVENGVQADCTVLDVGPWNTKDPYWKKANGRPQAETGRDMRGRRTNRAGIDLFNATWYKLLELRTYDRRLIENTTGEVEWQFNG